MEKVALWKICFPLVGHAWCIFQLGDIFCGKWPYPFPIRCPDGCRIIFCCATFIFKIAIDIFTFSYKERIPLITATNQYYLVLSLFVWAVLLFSRAFRKYSPNWLSLRSLCWRSGKKLRVLISGVLLLLTEVGILTNFQLLTHLNGTSQESPH